MIRIALLVAVVVAGSYGAVSMQKGIARDVDSALPVIQTTLGTTAHNGVDIDVWNRTVRIRQFSFRSDTLPELFLKIARIEVSGLGLGPGVLTADRVLINGLELEYGARAPGQQSNPPTRLVYKASEIVVERFSMPTKEIPVTDSANIVETVRRVLERLTEINATQVSIPAAWITTGPAQAPGSFGSADSIEHTLLNLTIRNLHDGKIAAILLDRMITLGAPASSGTGRYATETGKISISDLNLRTVLAAAAPLRGDSNDFMRLFRQAAVGSYAGILPNGNSVNIGSLAVSEFALRPSTVNLEQLESLAETAGRVQSPIQQRNLADQISALLTGLRIAQVEVLGIKSHSTADGPVEMSALRIKGLENGRMSDFIVEDLYAPRLKDPLRIGRFALTAVDIANLIRKSTLLATHQDPPAPDQIAGFMSTIEGMEVSDFSVPDKDTGQFIRFESFSASWGQFVGLVPGTVKFAAKAAIPVSGADNSPWKALADVGFRFLWLSFDASAAWTEADQTIVFPARVELNGLISAFASVSINNVQRQNFETDPMKFGEAAHDLEVGPIEFSLRDTGGLDLLIAHFAKTQDISLESARREIEESIDRTILGEPQTGPELQRLANTLGRFVTTRGATLKISITPKQRVNLMQLTDLINVNPLRALSQFNLELSVDR